MLWKDLLCFSVVIRMINLCFDLETVPQFTSHDSASQLDTLTKDWVSGKAAKSPLSRQHSGVNSGALADATPHRPEALAKPQHQGGEGLQNDDKPAASGYAGHKTEVPKNNVDNVASLVAQLSPAHPASVRERAVRMLLALTTDNADSRAEVCDAGGIEPLLEAMGPSSRLSEAVKEEAMKVLLNLARNRENRARVLAAVANAS